MFAARRSFNPGYIVIAIVGLLVGTQAAAQPASVDVAVHSTEVEDRPSGDVGPQSDWNAIVEDVFSADPEKRRWQLVVFSVGGAIAGVAGGTFLSFATFAAAMAGGYLLSANNVGLNDAFGEPATYGVTRGVFATGLGALAMTSIVVSSGAIGGGALTRVAAQDGGNAWKIALAACPGLVVSGFGALAFAAAAGFGWLGAEALGSRAIVTEVFATLGATVLGLALSAAGPIIAVVGSLIANVLIEPEGGTQIEGVGGHPKENMGEQRPRHDEHRGRQE